jgi:hypothetical protein
VEADSPAVDSRRRRGTWIAIGALVLVVTALAACLVMSWLGTYRQAERVQADVERLRAAVGASDWDAALGQLPAASSAARELASSTRGGPWRVLEAMPSVGSTAVATTALTATLADVLGAGEELAPYADRLLAGSIRGADGALDLSAFTEVAPLLNGLSVSLELAQERLASVSTTSVREPVASAVSEFADVAGEYAGTVAGAADIAGRVPALLGADGSRDWLVILQNPSEARGTGGFPGGYVILRADAGAISVASSGTSSDLNTTAIPMAGAPEDAQSLWGTELDAWNTYNLSPHFPTTGELSAAGMAARDTPVSGVIALDPAVVAGMLAVTGPVTAMGETVTSDNVESFFLVDVYARYPDSAQRDAVSMAIVGAVLQAFLTTTWDPQTLTDAFREPAEQGRLRVWSAAPDEQDWLASTGLGGVLPTDFGPTVAVALNNSAGNKLDAFVDSSIEYAPGLCSPGRMQPSTLRIVLRNGVPADLSNASGYYGRLDVVDGAPLSTSLLVHTYLPVDAEVTSATLDGEPVIWFGGRERNHPVSWVQIDLERGQERVLEYGFGEPTTVNPQPRVIVQPMARDTVVNVVPDPSCG